MSAPPKDPAISAEPQESAPPTLASKNLPSVQYSHLTPAEQAAQDLENATALQQAQDVIDAESGDNLSGYYDSAYDTTSTGSATTSLSSRVRDFAFENGRRYHKFREGAYHFPNDDAEVTILGKRLKASRATPAALKLTDAILAAGPTLADW